MLMLSGHDEAQKPGTWNGRFYPIYKNNIPDMDIDEECIVHPDNPAIDLINQRKFMV